MIDEKIIQDIRDLADDSNRLFAFMEIVALRPPESLKEAKYIIETAKSIHESLNADISYLVYLSGRGGK